MTQQPDNVWCAGSQSCLSTAACRCTQNASAVAGVHLNACGCLSGLCRRRGWACTAHHGQRSDHCRSQDGLSQHTSDHNSCLYKDSLLGSTFCTSLSKSASFLLHCMELCRQASTSAGVSAGRHHLAWQAPGADEAPVAAGGEA